jgi:hypothetical protein
MADYYPLIAKAVSGLDKSTVETRRALYDRARNALLGQLRGVEPVPSEPEITRERLALEEAIRKVESEAVRRSRGELLSARAELRPEPTRSDASPESQEDAEAPPGEGDDHGDTEEVSQIVPLSAAASARTAVPNSEMRRTERWTGSPSLSGPSLSDNGLRSFRESLSESGSPEDGAVRTFPGAARDTSRVGESPGRWKEQDDSGLSEESGSPLPRAVTRPPVALMDEEAPRARQAFPRVARPDRMPPELERVTQGRPGPSDWSAPRKSNRVVAIAVIGLLALGIAAVSFWFGDDILSSIRGTTSRTEVSTTTDSVHTKNTDRAPSVRALEGESGESATVPATQKVVLYEEDPTNPNGAQFVGTATWHTERVPPGAGQNPEVVIRGDIEIPEQKVSVRLSLRRNEDKQLPASHTVDIQFKLPPDFSHGGVSNIPGIMVKQGETNRGIALSGVAVKVMDNFFLVGLSSAEAEMQRNVQLLKDRTWWDIPIVYADGKRALIAIEKGPSGERAFAEAFAAWEADPRSDISTQK